MRRSLVLSGLLHLAVLALVVFGLWAFFWAVGNGQFDDLESSGWDVLLDRDE